MKKLMLLTLLTLFIVGCSKEELNDDPSSLIEDASLNFKQVLKEKYDGEIFKFKDTEDFTNFYNLLSVASVEEFEEYLVLKNGNNSSFYRSQIHDEEEVIEGEEDGLKITEGDFMISEFMSTIFNFENEIIIANKKIKLDKSGNFIDMQENDVIGSVRNSIMQEESSDNKAYNVNYSKSWRRTDGSKRFYLYIFNETVYINGALSTSKVFYRVKQKRKSCSFWRCKWKNDARSATFVPYLKQNGSSSNGQWYTSNAYGATQSTSSSSYTLQIATYSFCGVCYGAPFVITNGSFQYESAIDYTFYNVNYDFDPF